MNIKINAPYIVKDNNKCRLCAVVESDKPTTTLWFEVNEEFQQYFCDETADAFLVALLPYALEKKIDIDIDADISEQLYYQIKNYYIKVMAQNTIWAKQINLTAKNIVTKVFSCSNAVGTSVSCGVDSFYSILKHLNSEQKSFNLTHVVLFNNGMLGHYGREQSIEFSTKKINIINKLVDELDLKFIFVDTNWADFYNPLNPDHSAHILSLACVYSLQKLFRYYYYSSGVTPAYFNMKNHDTAYYDILNLSYLSNDNLTFYSDGMEVERLQKVDYITNFQQTYEYLNVCNCGPTNCSVCEKCVRTMLELFSIGKLDLYSTVFDLQKFSDNYYKFVGQLIANRKHSFYDEIYAKFVKNKIKIPISAYMYAYCYYKPYQFIRNKARKNKRIRQWYHKHILKDNKILIDWS